jgi:tRNA-modifying protein YgfZ
VDVEPGFKAVVVERLARFRLRSKIVIEPLQWECVALRGTRVSSPPDFDATVIAKVTWGSWSGVDLLGPAGSISVGSDVRWCGDDAWEAARIESGVPTMQNELVGVIPAETGLVDRAVSFTKGCYTGQELVARIDSRKAATPERLVGVTTSGEVAPSELIGASIWFEGRDRTAGRVTSAAWCPGLGAIGALAYLHRSVPEPANVTLEPPGSDRRQRAEVRSLPLV